jgi:hypothetical protein
VTDSRAEGVRVAYPLFHAGGGGSTPTSALQLWFRVLDVTTAIALNRLWHSRLPRLSRFNITGSVHQVCYAAEYEGVFYAVAVWTNPVARLLPQRTWLELRRLAIAPDAPKNTASRMLGWMARDIRQRFPAIEVLVSYQDKEVHTGTIYRAAGWAPGVMTEPRSRPWNHASRSRNEEQSRSPKQRWEKEIRR